VSDNHRFPTDHPLHLHLRSGRGTVQVVAEDLTEAAVDISGRDSNQVRVGLSNDGRVLAVEVPRHRWLSSPPRLDITVRIPSGSTVELGTASASITTRGPLAKADVKTASGEVSIEQVDGDCHADAASGDLALGTIGGAVRLRSASGDLRVARVVGRCTAKSASGAVDIGWAGDLVSAVSVSGAVTVRDAARGEVVCKTTSGNVAVGVRKGTLVWLDLTTVSGRTTSGLSPDQAPSGREETLTVKVQTVSGNITISPSGADAAAA
jgi:DUF4097 and DUF4098 domain-containing protein YvlB